MRLLFLGTGASQGYPALFCRCVNCTTARKRGGKSLRRRSAVFVNDDLLIDFGPDIVDAVRTYQIELYPVEHLLLTHGHGDHLHTTNFNWHRTSWSDGEIPFLNVYGSDATLAPLRNLPWPPEDVRLTLHPVEPGQTWSFREYRVTALPAHHGEPQRPLMYIVQQGDAAFLYASDTGTFPAQAWDTLERLKAEGMRLDCAVIEGTMGKKELPPDAGHMNFARCVEHHQMLRDRRMTKPGCVHLATHFAAGSDAAPPHEETTEILAPHGVLPAYDGMVLTLGAGGA